jgi:hypothetical protein
MRNGTQNPACLQSGDDQGKPARGQDVIIQAGSAFKAETPVYTRSLDVKSPENIFTLDHAKIGRPH